MSVPLLTTKLFIPPPARNLVDRPRLAAKLQGCLRPGCRLGLISAPAGFGKTTLISSWAAGLKADGQPALIAWLSLDDGDNDPVSFWTYLITALQTQKEGLGSQALNLLQTMTLPDLEGNLIALVNDLTRVPDLFLLVLDDYHLIRNPAVHQSLTFFIERMPAQFHVIIVSRTDPPLPLALLRGRDQLLEIRMNDLRLSFAEADSFLNSSWDLNLAAQAVQALNGKTEGWVAGLQMAALSLHDTTALVDHTRLADFVTKEDFISSFSGSNRYILDYLIEEVLNRQPARIQNFLMRTSILGRLCGPLCDALLADAGEQVPSDAQNTLEYLEGCNLFIVPIDDQRYWYRYHQLFTELLQKRLSQLDPGAVPGLHRRAVRWYEQNGLIPQAVEHAFLARDLPKAAELVSRIAEELWGRGEHTTLLEWIDALPEEEVQHYPHLWVWQVSMLISAGKLKEAERYIPAIENYIQTSLADGSAPPALIGRVYSLRTYIASFYNDIPNLYRNARLALENLSRAEDTGGRCGILMVQSNAYLNEGKLTQAAQSLIESIEDGKKARKPSMIMTGIANLVIVYCLQGKLKHAAQVVQEGLLLIQQNGLEQSPNAANLYIGWGYILSERNELEEAEKMIRQGLDLAQEHKYVWGTAWGSLALTRLLLARGRLEEAEAVIRAAEQLAGIHEIPRYYTCWISALKVTCMFRQGKRDEAWQVLQNRQIQPDQEIRFPQEVEYLVLARLYMERADLSSAVRLLERVLQRDEAMEQTTLVIQGLILRALVDQEQGSHNSSMQTLSKALDMAEPEGFVQVFLDETVRIKPLLMEAIRQNIHAGFARRLLDILASSPGEPEPDLAQINPVRPGEGILIQPLSKRELEILQLIAQGASNKEIAQKLYISVRTVKYYTTSLFTKLEVSGRVNAIIKARALGLLN